MHGTMGCSIENSRGWIESERLAALRRCAILDADPEPAFDDIAMLASSICSAPIAVINFIDADRQWFMAEIGLGVRETPLDISICRHAILQKGLFVVPDTARDPRFARNPLVVGEPRLRFYAGALLETEDGLPLGTLCVLDHSPRPEGLPREQEQALAALARSVMKQLELRRANISLAESERRFRVLADSMPQMVWSTLPDGNHDYFNQRWYEFTGVVEGSTDGEGWKGVFHADDQAKIESVWSRSLRTGLPYEIKYRLRHHSGQYRWTLGRALPVRDASGQIERWFGTCTDIHEAEETKAALVESEARYRALVDASAMIVWRASPDGAILNGCGWEALSGQNCEQYRGHGWLEAVHPDDRERVVSVWVEMLANPRASFQEYRVRATDGQYRWVRANGVPMFHADGSVREWVGTISDIHENKTAEEALRSSEERYRALVEASATVSWRATPHGAIKETSGWGMDADQNGEGMIGHAWLDGVHPDDRAAASARWQAAIQSGTNLHNEYRFFIRGGYEWVRANAVALRDDDGAIREWVGTTTNIHEERIAQQNLRESEQRYRALVEATATTVWRADASGAEIAPPFPPSYFAHGGDDWAAVVHPDDRTTSTAKWEKALAASTPLDVIERKLTVDGEYRWTHVRAQPLKHPDGTVREWVGAVTDIHERVVFEKELRASEERLTLALCAGRMVAWERDLLTGTIQRSENSLDMLGLNSGSVADFLARVHPDDRARTARFFEGVESGGSSMELRYFALHGQIWLGVRAEKPAPDRLIGITFDITDRKAAEEEIWRSANHDPLTGLPNRALFQKRLEEALEAAEAQGANVSLLLIDLDEFKDVNDSLGHDAGDALLHETAKRLAGMVREGETVARIGGDEFAMILVEPTSMQQAAAFADSVVRKLRSTFEYAGRVLSTRASIGVAVYPDHHREAPELMKDADIALYRAKAAGRARAVVYTESARAETQRRIQVTREVRAGLQAGQFVPFYQPKVCLKTGQIVGFEALARWQHPVTGILTPGYFGEAFSDAEVAVALGEQIVRGVAADIRSWMEKGVACGHVAVNLSSAEFADPYLAQHILRILEEYSVPPTNIEIEVTESVFLGRSAETVLATLMRFHERGVKIALDDFGTGFASLSHLKQFPVDHIKIDQSFVRDLVTDRDDAAIVAAVVGLSQNLQLEVTAEGVETEEQAQRLREMGCDFAQGFFFGKPAIGSRIPWLLANWRPSTTGEVMELAFQHSLAAKQ